MGLACWASANAFRKFESQRDSSSKPRVARNELPWAPSLMDFNPNGVVADDSQGSSFLATLG